MTEIPTISLHDGNKIPQIGLGVWQAKDGEETKQAVLEALRAGYRHIDTAAVYQNESSVGAAIKESGIPRSEIFLTTKLWNSDQGSEKVRPALEASLERLGLDYVDLYLIHWPTPARDLIVETWQEFAKLKSDGLTKSIGVSNFRVEDLEKLKIKGLDMPVLNQIELHPKLLQKELRDYGANHGIAIESWSPIGGSRGNILEDSTIAKIAAKHEKSVAQVIIRWHIQHGLIVIPKSVKPQRIRENFDVFDFELSDDDMNTIDQLGDGERIGPNPATMNVS